MVDINLLDWRQEQRKRQRLLFLITFAGCVALSIMISLFMLIGAHNATSHQQIRLNFLSKEVKSVEARIQSLKAKEKTNTRSIHQLKTIHRLQADRFIPVQMLGELVRTTPSGITLLKLTQDKDQITLVGQAETDANITRLVNNIKQSKLFLEPQLNEISLANDLTKKKHFTIRTRIHGL